MILAFCARISPQVRVHLWLIAQCSLLLHYNPGSIQHVLAGCHKETLRRAVAERGEYWGRWRLL